MSIQDIPKEIIANIISQKTGEQAVNFLRSNEEYSRLLRDRDFMLGLLDELNIPRLPSLSHYAAGYQHLGPATQLELAVMSNDEDAIRRIVGHADIRVYNNNLLDRVSPSILHFLFVHGATRLDAIGVIQRLARMNSTEYVLKTLEFSRKQLRSLGNFNAVLRAVESMRDFGVGLLDKVLSYFDDDVLLSHHIPRSAFVYDAPKGIVERDSVLANELIRYIIKRIRRILGSNVEDISDYIVTYSKILDDETLAMVEKYFPHVVSVAIRFIRGESPSLAGIDKVELFDEIDATYEDMDSELSDVLDLMNEDELRRTLAESMVTVNIGELIRLKLELKTIDDAVKTHDLVALEAIMTSDENQQEYIWHFYEHYRDPQYED